MCDLLGLKSLRPKKLRWQESVYLGRRGTASVPIDYLYVGGKGVTLAKRMQGVLTPEEWRPLIGSVLLQRSWAGWNSRKILAGSILFLVAYYIVVVTLISQTTVLGTISSTGAFFLYPFLPALVIWLSIIVLRRLFVRTTREDRLQADLQVAEKVGRDTFLTVLRKMDNLGFASTETMNRVGSMRNQPTIQERIQNLNREGHPIGT